MPEDRSKFDVISDESGTTWSWAGDMLKIEHLPHSIEVRTNVRNMYSTPLELRALARNLLQIADYVEQNNSGICFDDAKTFDLEHPEDHVPTTYIIWGDQKGKTHPPSDE